MTTPTAPTIPTVRAGGSPAPPAQPAPPARSWSTFTARMAVDAAAVTVLLVAGLAGFWPAFGGGLFIRPALIGLVAGAVVAWAGMRWRLGPATVTTATVVAYLMLGTPAALPGQGIWVVLPTRASVLMLVSGSVGVWRQFITATTPVDAFTDFTLVPFIVALLGCVVSYTIVWRATRALFALIPVATVAVIVAALGTTQPGPVTVQALLASGTLAVWIAWRRQGRARSWETSTVARRRWFNTGALILAGGLVAAAVSPLLGGVNRDVIRTHVAAPIDTRSYPSPLASFRLLKIKQADEALFTVTGWNPGDRLRLAVMDDYNGWVYAGTNETGSALFARVGPNLGGGATRYGGTRQTVSVTVGAYSDAWLPGMAVLDSIHFTSAQAATLSGGLYYNPVTDTAIEPAGLTNGDTYTVTADVPATTPTSSTPLLPVPTVKPRNVPDAVASLAVTWTADTKTPFDQVNAIISHLSDGYYSDGQTDQEPSLPGHSAARLATLLSNPQRMIGDGEQYAVAAALMLQALGISARVVLGFTTDTSGSWTVTGADTQAWIEVPFQGCGWVAFDPTPDQTRVATNTTQQNPPQPIPQVIKPAPPGSNQAEPQTRNQTDQTPKPPTPAQTPIPWRQIVIAGGATGIPLMIFLGPLLLIGGIKRQRRTRRRRDPDAAQSVIGGWQEILDQAADAGIIIPLAATRDQAAAILAHRYRLPRLLPLTREADAHGFGPDNPSQDALDVYWGHVDTVSTDLRAQLSPWRRYRAATAPTSLKARLRPNVSLDQPCRAAGDPGQAVMPSPPASMETNLTIVEAGAAAGPEAMSHVPKAVPALPDTNQVAPPDDAVANPSGRQGPRPHQGRAGFVETTW